MANRISGRGQRSRHRRAAVLILVVAVMGIAAVLLAVWVQSAVRGHKQLQLRVDELQALWLVEAGLERAAAHLAQSPDYDGERWDIAADQLGASDGAVVTIEVERTAEDSDRRLIHVQADYPPGTERRARHTKNILLDLTKLGEIL